MVGRPRDSEVEAYGWIRDQLKMQGWVVKPPDRVANGQVWTQNQCLADGEIRRCLGATRPENIVKVSETQLWLIEAKRDRSQLDQALREAIEDYSTPINEGGKLTATFASGVAGNDHSGYLVSTKMWVDSEWKTVTINDRDTTALLSPNDVEILLRQQNPSIRDFVPDQELFLKVAERINTILHNGRINKNDRAKVMAALLLSVLEEPGPNLDAELRVLIREINGRAENILITNGKPEFAPFVEIRPPTNTTNHVKYRQAIVWTLQELRNLNIKSAMDSSTDVLGQFYEVFLKYGNGAKEIGIVLTPRHITRFAVDVIGVSVRDVVLDPACGTGGFLVAAFDQVRKGATAVQVNRFKNNNLFGIEQESYIAVLAIVNMIFRGDGRNNITEGSCFSTYLKRKTIQGHPSAEYVKEAPDAGEEAITKVLMNPPFSDDPPHTFVTKALKMMEHGGFLFSILPTSTMFKSGKEKEWRLNQLVGENTLLAVVTLPPELFYPVSVYTLGVFIKKGIPHPREQKVLWIRAVNDGMRKTKGKRLPDSRMPNDLDRIRELCRSFIDNQSNEVENIPRLQKAAPIDFEDSMFELVPEEYIDQEIPTEDEIQEGVEKLVRETAAFLIRSQKENDYHADD